MNWSPSTSSRSWLQGESVFAFRHRRPSFAEEHALMLALLLVLHRITPLLCSYCSQGPLVNISPMDIARFYLAVRKEAAAGGLCDGAGHRVHYNMRVLVRALK
jgi:hypothetical protein